MRCVAVVLAALACIIENAKPKPKGAKYSTKLRVGISLDEQSNIYMQTHLSIALTHKEHIGCALNMNQRLS